MTPYAILLFLVVLCFALFSDLKIKNKFGKGFFLFIGLFLLITFSGLRSVSVGTDSQVYLNMWHASTETINSIGFFDEPLFTILNYATKKISLYLSLDEKIYFLSVSFLVCYLYIVSITNNSNYPLQCIFIFISLGFYTFHFNGARQAIAVAIFLYAYKYILSGELLKYITMIFIGFLFHKSILITVPFYFFFRVGLNKRSTLLIVIGAVVSAILVQEIVNFASTLDTRYSSYADAHYAGGGIVTVVFFTAVLVWLWIVRSLNKIRLQLYDHSLLAVLVAVCVGWVSIFLSLNPSGVLRLIVYFTQFLIFSLPISVMSFSSRVSRVIIGVSVYLLLLLYFVVTTSSFSSLTPYEMSIEFPL